LALFAWSLALWAAAFGNARAQQQCPELKVFCQKNVSGTQTRCAALVSGSTETNAAYEWSVSLPVPVQKFLGQENEVGIDLSQFPGYALTVTVKVSGLPEGCPNTASFELNSEEAVSLPPRPLSEGPELTLPTVAVSCPEKVKEGLPLYFNAAITDGARDARPVYNWTISSGKITGGQNTRTITVDTSDQGNQIIRATVEVSGMGRARIVSCATVVEMVPKAYKLAEYDGQDLEEEEMRLRRFFLRMKTGLDERAFIIGYGSPSGPRDEAQRIALRAKQYLVETFGADKSRITVLAGGRRERATIELWVVGTGAEPPVPNPSIRKMLDDEQKKSRATTRKERAAEQGRSRVPRQ